MNTELKKQLIDQPLHVLMTFGSVWVIAWLVNLVAPPFHAALFSMSFTAVWVAYREGTQWPSSRWWDPPMDWFFEAVGLGLGVWSFLEVMK